MKRWADKDSTAPLERRGTGGSSHRTAPRKHRTKGVLGERGRSVLMCCMPLIKSEPHTLDLTAWRSRCAGLMDANSSADTFSKNLAVEGREKGMARKRHSMTGNNSCFHVCFLRFKNYARVRSMAQCQSTCLACRMQGLITGKGR